MIVPALLVSVLAVVPYGDLRLRDDFVHGRPGATEDLHRQRATLRTGLGWSSTFNLGITAGVRASLGSDTNRESLTSFDNEESDTIAVDRLAVELWSAASDRLIVGKMTLPLRLSELVWDDDLRPVGVMAVATLDRLGLPGAGLAGGYVRRADLGWDDGGLAAAQASYRPPGTTLEAFLTFLHLDGFEELARQGRVRQNAPAPGGYASDYDLMDLQLGGSLAAGVVPLAGALDVARNFRADDDQDAIRIRLVAGGAAVPLGAALGWVYQQAGRDAVLGAYNSDDWWFHSRARGHRLWVEVGAGRPVSLRVSGFTERRDDLARPTRRLLVEIQGRLPGN